MSWGGWTPELVERAKNLHRGGHSFSQIAAIIGAPSRSSVIGKMNRLGLNSANVRPSAPRALIWSDEQVAKLREMAGKFTAEQIAKELGIPITKLYTKAKHLKLGLRTQAAAPASKIHRVGPAPEPMALVDEPEIPSDGRGLTVVQMPLFGRCRFPIAGISVNLRMCGEPTTPETATYCPSCAQRAYEPAIKKAKK